LTDFDIKEPIAIRVKMIYNRYMIKNKPFEIMNNKTGQTAVVESVGISGDWYLQDIIDMGFTDIIEWDKQGDWQKI